MSNDLGAEQCVAPRHGVRDHLLLLMMYRHGLRVSELIAVKVADVNLQQSRLWVRRLKNGLSVEQPIPGDELRALKRYLRQRDSKLPWLFLSERGQPLTRQSVSYIVSAAAERAGLEGVHPHTLRHSCVFYLANRPRTGEAVTSRHLWLTEARISRSGGSFAYNVSVRGAPRLELLTEARALYRTRNLEKVLTGDSLSWPFSRAYRRLQ